jgi:hypothetical protein
MRFDAAGTPATVREVRLPGACGVWPLWDAPARGQSLSRQRGISRLRLNMVRLQGAIPPTAHRSRHPASLRLLTAVRSGRLNAEPLPTARALHHGQASPPSRASAHRPGAARQASGRGRVEGRAPLSVLPQRRDRASEAGMTTRSIDAVGYIGRDFCRVRRRKTVLVSNTQKLAFKEFRSSDFWILR